MPLLFSMAGLHALLCGVSPYDGFACCHCWTAGTMACLWLPGLTWPAGLAPVQLCWHCMGRACEVGGTVLHADVGQCGGGRAPPGL